MDTITKISVPATPSPQYADFVCLQRKAADNPTKCWNPPFIVDNEEIVDGPQNSSRAYDPGISKSTGKERDSESGLDYFGARYYGSALGRFTSPDPESAGADASNPQSWNAYAYVNNSPLTNTDPDGEATCSDGSYADVCVTDQAPPAIDLVPLPQGPQGPTQIPATNPGPVQPVSPSNPSSENCVAGFAATGAAIVGGIGVEVGTGVGALAGGGAGTLALPGGGTIAGGIAGGAAGGVLVGAAGAYYGGQLGASVGSIVCASSGGTGGSRAGGPTSGGGSNAKSAKKLSTSRADEAARKGGYAGAEDLKKALVGSRGRNTISTSNRTEMLKSSQNMA